MNTFWRDTDLSETETALFMALFDAHYKSVFRDNPSSVTMQIAASSSNDYVQSLCAALLTTGGPHAPLVETGRLLEHDHPDRLAILMIEAGDKVPGWGNGFVKDGIDPLWQPVHDLIEKHWPVELARLDAVTGVLRDAGKMIWPNPSAYTALTGIILKLPLAALPWLFVASRLNGWTKLFIQQQKVKA